VAFKSGQTDRALQLLRDARLRDPNNSDTRYFLAAALAGAGRQSEAREELKTALQGGTGFASAKLAQELLQTLK
jgi:Flp pilus assembly protein TadD